MEDEVVIASSSIEARIGCWGLRSGAEHLRYRSCASPPHGLVSVVGRFLASSQLRDSSSSSGSVLFWSWNKVEVKSFPAEAINPLACNSDGTYIVGGGVSCHIYLWEEEEFLVIFTCGRSEDGTVRVWSLLMIFYEEGQQRAGHLYEYSFTGHALPVTDIVTGYGGSNAIILSASLDRTCKVWSLSRRTLLRNIVFPSIIVAVALDPGEHVFYAGGRDGKIYIAELNAQTTSNNNNNYGLHIIGTLSDQSKAICSLGFALDGFQLAVGSEDGMVRVWDTEKCGCSSKV
ncbi:unnamed protein product [Lactuca virosa]|uniref:Neurobeachin beta-propeller domain-containing protein n=1 Tax=Lactuca virosa TaxID=75947 RepID=A0AAU9MZQ6_9ASTR|nr:unnamed protein product [Lactuca virosa]